MPEGSHGAFFGWILLTQSSRDPSKPSARPPLLAVASGTPTTRLCRSCYASGRSPTALDPLSGRGARLAVSFSLSSQGGGQPISGASGADPGSPPFHIEKGVPDLPTKRFLRYGHYEGTRCLTDGQAWDQAELVHDWEGCETSPNIPGK